MLERVISVLLLAYTIVSARAVLFEFELRGVGGTGLLPGNEVPPNATAAYGVANGPIIYESDTDQLSFDITVSNLSGALSAVEIHGPADTTHSAHLLYDLFGYANPSTGRIAGTLTLLTNPNGSGLPVVVQEGQLINGEWYIDVQSAGPYSNGEIRGNIAVAPEPGVTLMITGVGLGCLGASKSHRRWRAFGHSIRVQVFRVLLNASN